MIAGKMNEYNTDLKWPMTHAAAYKEHGGFNLLACVDPNVKSASDFAARWNIDNFYDSLDKCLSDIKTIDVVSICVPTSNHYEILMELLKHDIKAVFCEKPLTNNFEDSFDVINKYAEAKLPLIVNYTRRWNQTYTKLKQSINNNEYGDIKAISAIYNKGLFNNGSHIINLIGFLFGHLDVVNVGDVIYDHFEHDPTVNVTLKLDNNVQVNLIGTNSNDFYIFEMILILQKAVISIEQSGCYIRVRNANKSGHLPGQLQLENVNSTETLWSEQFCNAVTEVYESAINPILNVTSTGRSAFETQKICDNIKLKIVH